MCKKLSRKHVDGLGPGLTGGLYLCRWCESCSNVRHSSSNFFIFFLFFKWDIRTAWNCASTIRWVTDTSLLRRISFIPKKQQQKIPPHLFFLLKNVPFLHYRPLSFHSVSFFHSRLFISVMIILSFIRSTPTCSICMSVVSLSINIIIITSETIWKNSVVRSLTDWKWLSPALPGVGELFFKIIFYWLCTETKEKEKLKPS